MTPATSSEPTAASAANIADPRIVRSRARVLDAARELLVEFGPRGVTVDAVSERSGVAKSTMYRHWDSRTSLLIDLVQSCMPDLTAPGRGDGFVVALRTHLAEVADALADESYALAIASLITLKRQMPELADAMDAERSSKTEVIETIIELGREEGLFGDEMTASRLMSLLVGPLVFDAAFQDGIGDTIDERAEHLHGLAREAADRFLASLERTAPSGATV